MGLNFVCFGELFELFSNPRMQFLFLYLHLLLFLVSLLLLNNILLEWINIKNFPILKA